MTGDEFGGGIQMAERTLIKGGYVLTVDPTLGEIAGRRRAHRG